MVHDMWRRDILGLTKDQPLKQILASSCKAHADTLWRWRKTGKYSSTSRQKQWNVPSTNGST